MSGQFRSSAILQHGQNVILRVVSEFSHNISDVFPLKYSGCLRPYHQTSAVWGWTRRQCTTQGFLEIMDFLEGSQLRRYDAKCNDAF